MMAHDQSVVCPLGSLHRDPNHGAPIFAEPGAARELTWADLRSRPWQDLVPRKTRAEQELVLVETGGTTGRPICVAYTHSGFRDNFVTPFRCALGNRQADFAGPWLFVGPTGPHAIGLGADAMARDLCGQPAYKIDLDPRWLRKLAPGILHERYLDHVLEQALEIMASRLVAVLFSTPPLILSLAQNLSRIHRERIQGIHWGGVGATQEELSRMRADFPRATILAGFGNSLVGLFPEVGELEGQPLFGWRGGSHLFRVEDDSGQSVPVGSQGFLVVGRKDTCLFLQGLRERDLVLHTRDAEGRPAFQPRPERAGTAPQRGIY